MSEEHHVYEPIADEQFQCCECHTVIAKGQQYRLTVIPECGRLVDYKQCCPCADLFDDAFVYCGLSGVYPNFSKLAQWFKDNKILNIQNGCSRFDLGALIRFVRRYNQSVNCSSKIHFDFTHSAYFVRRLIRLGFVEGVIGTGDLFVYPVGSYWAACSSLQRGLGVPGKKDIILLSETPMSAVLDFDFLVADKLFSIEESRYESARLQREACASMSISYRADNYRVASLKEPMLKREGV